ncbi:hypothetical protein [Methanoregula sp.]|uniref:hypothetical protein n=1 Tax=Methanoregula sp. TaxID=2052170 RepID=UPI00356A3D59
MNGRKKSPEFVQFFSFFKRDHTLEFFFIGLIFLLLLPSPVTAEEKRVTVNYTFIDEGNVSLWDPSAWQSHLGLSQGVVAYHKGQTIYTWDSKTGERQIFEIPPEANYNTEITALDIADGVVYYGFDKRTKRVNHGTEGGLYAFDGKNNTPVAAFFHHDIMNIIADHRLVLIHDTTNSGHLLDSGKRSAADLFIYSPDFNGIIPVDNRIDRSDPVGFGGNTVATLTEGIEIPHETNKRLPDEGMALFSLDMRASNRSVTPVTIPSATNIHYPEESIGVSPDCCSEDYVAWTKTTGTSTSGYHSTLFLTNISTLKTVPLCETDGAFSDDSYAIDGDYVFFGRTLYHIPTGTKTEISFNGGLDKLFDGEPNENTSQLDIVRFNDGGLLIKSFPKEKTEEYARNYQLWYADLGPVIHPAKETPVTTTGTIPATIARTGSTEAPVSGVIPGLAVIFVVIVCSFRKKN